MTTTSSQGIPGEPADWLGQHADFVTRLSRSLAADDQLAADAAQETMLRAMRAPPRHGANLHGWLATVLRRTIARLRRKGRSLAAAEALTPSPEADPSPLQSAVALELHRELLQAVAALGEPYREAVTLRYLEGLSVDEVAERAGVPRNTARSRLTRALAMLREQLDQRHGERSAWLLLLTPLARRPLQHAVTGVVTPLSSMTLLTIAMNKTVWTAAAVVLLAAGLGWYALRDPALVVAEPDSFERASAAPATWKGDAPARPAPSQPSRRSAVPLVKPPGVAAGASPAGSTDAAALPKRWRLVDAFLQPMAGVSMRRCIPATVRWQGGDVGWIANNSESLRLSEQKLQRIRGDAAFAETFFSARKQPEQWRATLLGEPLPEQDRATERDGSFAFAAAGANAAAMAIAVAELEYCLLATPLRGARTFVAAPAVSVRGRVLDSQGRAIAGAFLSIDVERALPPGLIDDLSPLRVPAVRSGRDGGYVLRRAPTESGVLLRVRADGFAPLAVPMPGRNTAGLDLTMWPVEPGQGFVVDGVVVDEQGAGLAGATVAVARNTAKTAADGAFSLEFDAASPDAKLTVFAAGYQPWQARGFGRRLRDDRYVGRRLDIRLDRAKELRLLVLHADGRPCAGVQANLVDATLLGYSFTSVEARAGARKRAVAGDDGGRVRLTGLANRAYRVRVWQPATGVAFTTDPLIPSNAGQEGAEQLVALPPSMALRSIRGRCVDGEGEPVAGAGLTVAFCTYVTSGGGTMWEDRGALGVTGNDGRFELQDVPSGGDGVLIAQDRSGSRAVLPLAAIGGDGDACVLRFDATTRWLRLLPAPTGAPALPVVCVAGADREARAFAVWRDGQSESVEFVSVDRPLLVELPADASAVRIAPNTRLQRDVVLDAETTHVHVRGAW
ncbi:MAG: sigma-70 family RNA polymerase sigma factor [Planctomycetota bacterium]